MSIVWFRDLSITIVGLVASAVLIYMSVMVYRLHRLAKATMESMQAASRSVNDTANLVQACIQPLFPILALIQGIRGGIKGFGKMFKKEYSEGGNCDE